MVVVTVVGIGVDIGAPIVPTALQHQHPLGHCPNVVGANLSKRRGQTEEQIGPASSQYAADRSQKRLSLCAAPQTLTAAHAADRGGGRGVCRIAHGGYRCRRG